MKKLMTMLAAVATAFGLYAADAGFISGAGFDSTDADETPNLTWTHPSGFVDGFWTGTDGTNAIITAGTATGIAVDNHPAYFTGDQDRTRDGILTINSSKGLIAQKIKSHGTQTIGDDGFYFDGLVQFTAFDEMPVIAEDAKIAVFPMLEDAEDESKGTNLWIYADGTETNFWKTTATIDGEWHRVTIKMINDILKADDASQVGFVVYVDGNKIGTTDAMMDEALLTPEAQSFNKNGYLFGAVGAYSAEVSEVAFGGKGAIDEIAFTETAPKFAESPKFAYLTGDEGIASFMADGQTWNGGDAIIAKIEGVDSNVVVTAITAADGYFIPAGGESFTFSNVAGDAELTVTGAQTLGATVVIDDVPQYFETAADALEALNDGDMYDTPTEATLTLNAETSDAIELDNANITLTLDLAGKTIEGDSDVITVSEGSLTITNSTDTIGKVVATGKDDNKFVAVKAMAEEATLNITAGIFDGEAKLVDDATISITGGKFLASKNDAEDLNEFVVGDFEFVGDGQDPEYLILQPVAKTGTVIFICEKNEFSKEFADQEATVKIADIAPEAAEVEGSTLYTFDGWFKDQACKEAIADMTVPAGETTYIYARAKDPATLTFTTTIGTAPQAVTVKLGSAWGTAPEMADAENIFNGWAKEGEVVAADFWTAPVEASDEVAADWTPAGATAGGVAYATIKAALEAPASSNQTVKFLADIAQADAIASVKTSAATIDFNGKNVAITAITYAGDDETFTVKNGENGQWEPKTITVPAGVGLTIQDMLCYGQTTVKGGAGAVLTVKDNTFSDLYDAKGNTGVPTAKTEYASYCVTLSGAFARADITGNTFCQMVRAGISGGDTATTMFVYDNIFLGTKNCMTPAQKDERYAAMQIAKANKIYMENNVYSNENYGTELGMVQGAIRVDDANVSAMVFSGNLFADGDIYFWNRRGGDSVTKNVFYGLNEATETDFRWGEGIKAADISTVVPAYTPGTNPLALPEGVDSIYVWLHGENADKPYVVNGDYYATLPKVKADDVIIVEPTLALDFALEDAEQALENVTVEGQVKANMFKVIAKPQEVTIAVTLQNVNSVTYTGVVQNASFDIANVAKGTTITISDIVADDQYEVSVTCSKDITDNGDGTFTVAADLSSPNATIDFVGTPMKAVAYTIDGDTIAGRYDINNITEAWTMAKDGIHYVKMFGDWAKSTSESDLAIDAVCRINNDGGYKLQVKAATGYQVASITRDASDKFDIYTPYATLQAAVDAEANATEMFVTGAKVDLSTLTLTSAKNTFKGHFGDGVYTGITGSFAEGTEPVCDWSCQATSTWGAEGKTFAFVAEAVQQQVTFAANGGEGTQAAIDYYAGDAITAPECTFTAPKDGKFNCWSNATTFATYAVGAALPTDVASYELVADWTIASSPWPTPDPEKPEAEAVAEAMTEAGFSPAAAAAIGTKDAYTAFQGYCDAQSIIPSEVGAAKDNAVLTYALGADACNEEITSEDITITAYDQATGKLTVEIEGVTAGETINSTVLAKILTAKGGEEVTALDPDDVTVEGYAPADGKVELTVTPKATNPTAFFYQIELKK